MSETPLCLSSSLDDLGLEISCRLANCLRNLLGPNATIADVIAAGELEILRTPNLGKRSINELKEVLDRHGFRLPFAKTPLSCHAHNDLWEPVGWNADLVAQ